MQIIEAKFVILQNIFVDKTLMTPEEYKDLHWNEVPFGYEEEEKEDGES